MSREGDDCSYKPQKGAIKTEKLTRRTNRSQRAAKVDYMEGETSSDTETEGMVNMEGVQREDCKLE